MKGITFLIDNKELFGTFFGFVIAFFTGRKSKKQSEKTTELENIEKVRIIEKKLLLDMEEHIKKLINYNDYLEGIVNDLKIKLVKYVDKYGEV